MAAPSAIITGVCAQAPPRDSAAAIVPGIKQSPHSGPYVRRRPQVPPGSAIEGPQRRARNGCLHAFRVAGYRRASPLEINLMRNRQQDGLAVRAYVLALAVTVAGCSGSELVQNWTPSGPAPALDLPQPDYRRVVADNLKFIFPKPDSLGDVEISGARLVDHLKGPAWITCLKLDAHGKPQHYAVFIQDGKIIETRAGIVIDQCHKETYTPLTTAVAKKPGT
jgi:hypothetical protein